MKQLHAIIIFLSLVSISCSKTIVKEVEGETIEVNLTSPSDLSLYDMFSEIEVIPLETGENSFLKPPILKTIIHNDKYYILDWASSCIFVFNPDGTLHKTIDKRGGGPAEYSSIEDFSINKFTGNLELLAREDRVHIYDNMGETLIESFVVPELAHNFINISDSMYIFLNNTAKDEKTFVYSLKEKDIINRGYRHIPSFLLTTTIYHHFHTPFYNYDGRTYFYQGYNGQVYEIDSIGNLHNRLKWDMGKNTFDYTTLSEEDFIEFNIPKFKALSDQYASAFSLCMESDKYLVQQFYFKEKPMHLFYNKDKKDAIYVDRFKEDIAIMAGFTSETALFSYVDITDSRDRYFNIEVLNKEQKEIIANLAEDANPILVKYHFKQ